MKALFSTIIVSMFFFVNAFAQTTGPVSHNVSVTVPSVSMISVVGTDGNTNVSLVLDDINAAGEWFSNVTSDEVIYLRLSSVKPGGARIVKVSGEVPAGLILKVSAGDNTGGGKGKTGLPQANVTITDAGASLITEIGSGYTGIVSNGGFPLTYNLSASDTQAGVEALAAGSTTIEVFYTITEE